MTRPITAMCAALVWASALDAQQPKTSGQAPEATFKSLEETLGGVGRVENVWHYRDDKTGAQWTAKLGMEYSNVRADAAACRVDYDWRRIVNGQPTEEQHNTLLLSQGWHVSVLRFRQ